MIHILKKDGEEILRSTKLASLYACIHRQHPFSAHHAFTFEGFSIESIEDENTDQGDQDNE